MSKYYEMDNMNRDALAVLQKPQASHNHQFPLHKAIYITEACESYYLGS